MNKKLFGFTLAEVLITLAIIGVVAALTLPTLITNHQKKETVTRLQKAYGELVQAVKLSEVDNGSTANWDMGLPAKDFIMKYLAPYFNSSKLFNLEKNKFPTYKSLAGVDDVMKVTGKMPYGIELPNGTIIFVDEWVSSTSTYRRVYIDINGLKGPNILGRDLFRHSIARGGYVLSNEKYGRESLISTEPLSCNKDATSAAGTRCLNLIILDNWQIKDDYPWVK